MTLRPCQYHLDEKVFLVVNVAAVAFFFFFYSFKGKTKIKLKKREREPMVLLVTKLI